MSLNACELEIDLFCRGMRVPADVSLVGARSVTRTCAGLGSGLEVVIPTQSILKPEVWVNVPVVEHFASESPYRLQGGPAHGYHIVDDHDGAAYAVRLPKEPVWYSRQTSRDVPMNHIGVLHGTSLGININMACAFWHYSPPLNCRFCTSGLKLGENEGGDKAISDVVETCWAAREESGVTFVNLNSGFQESRGVECALP